MLFWLSGSAIIVEMVWSLMCIPPTTTTFEDLLYTFPLSGTVLSCFGISNAACPLMVHLALRHVCNSHGQECHMLVMLFPDNGVARCVDH